MAETRCVKGRKRKRRKKRCKKVILFFLRANMSKYGRDGREVRERKGASEGEREVHGWRWMLVSGDVGGPLILDSSCLVIVYFFWPEIDCSRGR